LAYFLLFPHARSRPSFAAASNHNAARSNTMTDKKTAKQTTAKSTAKAAANQNADDAPSNAQKDPDTWVTGDESMTGAQRSYLTTLAEEAGTEVDDTLTKAEASKKIDELREQTGRGIDH
jgi:hypothetical protein